MEEVGPRGGEPGLSQVLESAARLQIAQDVRRLIAESGLSRTAFAAAIGTSLSRLSTYATGRVTPSAALMVRMRGVRDRVAPSSP